MTAPEGASTPDIGSIWPGLRRSIRTDASRALPLLMNLSSSDPTTDPAHRVDALTLLAETLQLLRRDTAAYNAAFHAVDAAQSLYEADHHPATIGRLLAATAVFADVTVLTGQPEALAVCDDYQRLLDDHHDLATGRRYHALGLHAVAVYHHDDRDRGRALLRRQLDADTDNAAIRAMLAAGLTTMDDHTLTPTPELPCPVPGGALHQAAHDPPVDYLTSRIRARPGVTRPVL